MPRLLDVRQLFRRKTKPVAIDLTGTQAESLTQSMGKGVEQTNENGEFTGSVDSPKKTNRIPPVVSSVEEVSTLVRKVGEHLDNQSDRTERLLTMLQQLPTAFETLPEIHRQNTCLLEELTAHFSKARARESALNESLHNLSKASDRQIEVMGLIQQQLDANHKAAERRTDALNRLDKALSTLAESHSRTGAALSGMIESGTRQQSELCRQLGRTHKWIITTFVCCAAASITALVIAIFALLQ